VGIQQKVSTRFHPQSDGQAERVNAALEGYTSIPIADVFWDLYPPGLACRGGAVVGPIGGIDLGTIVPELFLRSRLAFEASSDSRSLVRNSLAVTHLAYRLQEHQMPVMHKVSMPPH